MKNILRAMALVAIGTVSLAASANAMPAASSVAGLGEQASASVEQVGWGHRGGHRRFHGKRYWGGYHHGYKHHGYGYKHYGYGYGHGFSWKKFCYYKPYHWKCKHFGY